ncbi:MAG: purine-nucleoside phosphorylase [Gammaproteobacteria bacterium]|nr:purine-nucleoside phosphorylase [Gammaproteobacteria bacterium]MCD8542868.1 purine-nucleoside phosphorylase [Gammaproteobacteria bacterium]
MSSLPVSIQEAIAFVQSKAPNFRAKLGVVASSALSEFSNLLTDSVTIHYHDIPGVVSGTIPGHGSRLVLGYLNGVPLVCLQGRLHRYEGASYRSMQILINLIKGLGAGSVIITNVSGSLRASVGAGELVVINDHINFSFDSPLMGKNDDSVGPRFVSMTNTYDMEMRRQLAGIAHEQGFYLHEGVYVGVGGPHFETPAEIRMFQMLGGDVIGMSTIPDVLFARHCGLKLAVLSLIVNLGAGMNPGVELSHEHTLEESAKAAARLTRLIVAYISRM